MDENKKLQDRIRKEKYLNKMKNKNNNNDYIGNNNTNNRRNKNNPVLINNTTPVPKEDSPKQEITEKETFVSCAETFSDNNINNNNKNKKESESENDMDNNNVDLKESNTNSSAKINYVDTLKKANKYKYIINIFNLIKKLILIILTIIHCLKYFELDDISKFKYTILIIELSSLLINKLLNIKITNLIKNNKIVDNNNDNNNKNESDFVLNYFVELLYRLMKKSGPLNYIISFLFFVKDVFGDFWIIFLTNIIFFILTEED
jgi:hypothetical protein